MNVLSLRLSSIVASTALVGVFLFAGTAVASESASPIDNADSSQVLASNSSESGSNGERRPSRMLRRSVYDAGRWSLGVDGSFSMTTSSVELLDNQGQVTDTTRFMRIDPWVTVGVIDRLHVGLLFGLVSRRLAQDGLEATTDTAIAFQPLVQYHIPASRRLGLYGQLATGAYVGRSQRTIPDDDGSRVANERTHTRGFVLTVGAGINYRLTEGLQLRFGLAFNGIWGRENVETIDQGLSTSTTNLQTSAGLRYTF